MVRLTPLRLLCTTVVLCFFVFSTFVPRVFSGERGYDILHERPPPVRADQAPRIPFGEECSPFSAGVMNDVTIVLKIGAAETKTKLPLYLNRLGRCKQDLLIFSDRRDNYNGFEITDALSHLRPEYKYGNSDFDIYDTIQAANTTDEKSHEGWRLDKYKFLPMMEWTSYLRPESQWYVFVELDTYVNYDNLYRFLSQFNPQGPYYFGSPIWPKKKPVFAHGGTGYVLSRGALDRLMARGKMFADNHHFPGTHLFGEDFKKQCCGDEVLAQVLRKSGVSLRGYWPMFNGEKPLTVRFGKEHWCEAIITMHHLGDEDFTGLTQWEKARSHPNRPLVFEELFTMIGSHLQERVDDWSNMSEDVVFSKGNIASKSFDQCYGACLKDSNCLQYEYAGDECRLGHAVRLGQHQSPNGNRKWTSGWMQDRIKAFVSANSPCQGAHSVHPNP
ncbi:glycosyltransferase family 31 protein [Dothidotthia symphoricarpi CBS 119687]|uniref:N-acetylgalactosaminide beta-1,3-galactosyltransferase n=1 Tax=Dothidotthia symphoricarpi CBS 119687 TaxID=1392245 RepID=A0A6A6AJ78_9PLEO|nr:glycosyltransferase family 31 protein [Dothidotthia symphoricarpi CBS 119687]KAF2132032.1 glycosyltransferase family 31 protein [Dothidotthia symphoricarpi CBS 119687]